MAVSFAPIRNGGTYSLREGNEIVLGTTGWTLELVRIGPAEAAKLLELNTHNRRKRPRLIEQIKRDIQDGSFLFTPDAVKIAVGEDGVEVLQDGQNRLEAIKDSGRTVSILLARGPNVMDVLDTGISRTTADILMLRDEQDYATVAAVARMAWRQEKRVMHESKTVPSHSELLNFLSDNPDCRDAAIAARRARDKFKSITPSCLGAAIFHGRRVDAEAIDAFLVGLVTGENITKGDPAFMYREWLIRAKSTQRTPSTLVVAGATNRAVVAAIRGESLGVLRWTPSTSFPYIQDEEVIVVQ